jgi:hypothetical protein
MAKDSTPVREAVQVWVAEQWARHEMGAECLIAHLQQACERAVGKVPEAAFAAVTDPLAALAAPDAEIDAAALSEALTRLEQIVGRPDADTMSRPPRLVEALPEASAALVADWGKKLAVLAGQLIEQPEFRLAGAEEALRQFIGMIEQALRHYEPLAKELAARVAEARTRIESIRASIQGTPTGGRRAAAVVANLVELLRLYPKWRYQSLVLRQVAAAYVSLRGLLSDRLRELNFCRTRLGELLRGFEDPAAQARTERSPGRDFFPAGCRTLNEAIAHFSENVTAEDLRELDGRMQSFIQGQFQGLLHVCLSSANLLKNLEAAMKRQAEAFAESRLEGAGVAEMFLERHPDDEEARGEIVTGFDEAAPEFAGSRLSRQKEICILATPPGAARDRFRALAQQALPDVALAAAPSTSDVVFYREIPQLPLSELEQLGPLGYEAYRQMTSVAHFTPHSRTDITEWQVAVPG